MRSVPRGKEREKCWNDDQDVSQRTDNKSIAPVHLQIPFQTVNLIIIFPADCLKPDLLTSTSMPYPGRPISRIIDECKRLVESTLWFYCRLADHALQDVGIIASQEKTTDDGNMWYRLPVFSECYLMSAFRSSTSSWGHSLTYRVGCIVVPIIVVIVHKGIDKGSTKEYHRRSYCHTEAVLR